MPSVLITGAARGIGRAAALRLARAGWTVHAGVRQAADGVELAVAAGAGTRITPVVLDVADAAQVAALDAVLPGRLDAVVNNAGIAVGGPIEGLDLAELRRGLEVNVVGAVAVTQAVLPRLRASRGRVVFVSSVSGRVSSPMLGAYSASKFALEAIADALRVEVRPWGIAVVLIEPGAIDTDMWRTAMDTVAETEAGLAPAVRGLYARHLAGLRKAVPRIQRQTTAVDEAAAAIETALTAQPPRERYLVGTDARAQVALRAALPTRAFDTLVARMTGVPRAPRRRR
ncbi:MAG TPA: SDR family NAD(P)-dependent oxidoreductase [Baekduia sp.]|nr:SDR family NAD(P)-dependent oxidoreductase [Baekduia sp.]